MDALQVRAWNIVCHVEYIPLGSLMSSFGVQTDKGVKGPIIVHAAADPFAHMYTEEKLATARCEPTASRLLARRAAAPDLASEGWAFESLWRQIVAIADEWREPEICLKLEGGLPGNPVIREGQGQGQG